MSCSQYFFTLLFKAKCANTISKIGTYLTAYIPTVNQPKYSKLFEVSSSCQRKGKGEKSAEIKQDFLFTIFPFTFCTVCIGIGTFKNFRESVLREYCLWHGIVHEKKKVFVASLLFQYDSCTSCMYVACGTAFTPKFSIFYAAICASVKDNLYVNVWKLEKIKFFAYVIVLYKFEREKILCSKGNQMLLPFITWHRIFLFIPNI